MPPGPWRGASSRLRSPRASLERRSTSAQGERGGRARSSVRRAVETPRVMRQPKVRRSIAVGDHPRLPETTGTARTVGWLVLLGADPHRDVVSGESQRRAVWALPGRERCRRSRVPLGGATATRAMPALRRKPHKALHADLLRRRAVVPALPCEFRGAVPTLVGLDSSSSRQFIVVGRAHFGNSSLRLASDVVFGEDGMRQQVE
jgi:hypothetical protein